ncbi:MAG: Coenzyme F420 hydrogenase/dehydrogenase, beta subunit C-terminal domain [Dehalococcoidia bacterium]
MIELQDPSADIRYKIAHNSGVGDPLNKIWFHKTASAVIEAGRCVRCGSCVAACPSNSISVAEDGLPTLTRMCTGCSACWDFCPLAGLRAERLWKLFENSHAKTDGLGVVQASFSARAKVPATRAQDGGVVTTLLEELLTANEIDGVLVTKRRDTQRGQTIVARTVQEIRESAGSIYDQTLPLALNDLREIEEGTRLAMVGTPCQITSLRALQRYGWHDRKEATNAVKLTIGLFCNRSFNGLQLTLQLAKAGVDPRRMEKVNVSEGVLSVYDADRRILLERPVREFHGAALRGCDECADFSGRLADIAVGSVGSPDGWSTVLVRTEAGRKAWDIAQNGLIKEDSANVEEVARLERRNRTMAARNLKRPYDEDAALWISYEDHLRAYMGTDREPEPVPAYRSHHYTTAC